MESLLSSKSAGQYLQDHLIYVQFILISKIADERTIYVQRLFWNAEQLVKAACIEKQQKPEFLSLWKDHIMAILEKQELMDTTALKIANFLSDRSSSSVSLTRRVWQERFSIYTQLLREEMESYQKNRDVARSLSQFDYCIRILMQIGYMIDQLTIPQMTVTQIKLHMRNINHNIVLGLRHGRLNKVRIEMAKLKTWRTYIATRTIQDKRTMKTFENKLKRVRMDALHGTTTTDKQKRGLQRLLA